MEFLVIPILLIYLGYRVFSSAKEKRPAFLTLLWMILLVGLTTGGSYFYAAVRSSYGGHAEWLQEKQIFFGLFRDKLKSSQNLPETVKYMQSQEVKEKVLAAIPKILEPVYSKAILFLAAGGVILAVCTASLWGRKVNTHKYYPWALLLCVLIGAGLFDVGMYYKHYGNGTQKRLNHTLSLQQKYLMGEFKEREPRVNIAGMVQIIEQESTNVKDIFGSRFPELVLKEKPGRRAIELR